MKVAIIGKNLLGAKLVELIDQIGGSITWYWPKSCGEIHDYFSQTYQIDFEQKKFDSIKQNLSTSVLIRPCEIQTITKRYLRLQEDQINRFHDLFKIIYKIDPSYLIELQKNETTNLFEKLDEDYLRSLKESYEVYDYFDVVIDAREISSQKPIGTTGYALGENKAQTQQGWIDQKDDVLQFFKSGPTHDFALIGSGDQAAEVLLEFQSYLQNLSHHLFVITHEEEPFNQWFKETSLENAQRLKTILESEEIAFERDKDEFTKCLKEWNELDDFVRVKMPKPFEPIPRLVFFSGHQLSAIDFLEDQKKFFLTLEVSEYRTGRKQPENNHIALKTIGVQTIINCNGLEKRLENYQHLRVRKNWENEIISEEKGLFLYSPLPVTHKDRLEQMDYVLKEMKDELDKLFSPHPDTCQL